MNSNNKYKTKMMKRGIEGDALILTMKVVKYLNKGIEFWLLAYATAVFL